MFVLQHHSYQYDDDTTRRVFAATEQYQEDILKLPGELPFVVYCNDPKIVVAYSCQKILEYSQVSS